MDTFYYNIQAGNIRDVSTGQVPGYSAASGTPYVNNNGIANPDPGINTGNNSAKMYVLNGQTGDKTGLGIAVRVMAGDTVTIFGKSYYHLNSGQTPGNNYPITGALLNFLNAFTGTGAVAAGTHASVTGSTLNSSPLTTDGLTDWLGNSVPTPTGKPKAYINWILFDDQFKPVSNSSGFSAVNSSPDIINTHTGEVNITKNGYLYVYCSNESDVDVFFDNLQVVHARGPLLEETHYYPFGLTMAGISSKAVGSLENKYKFNGKELEHEEFSDGSGLEWYEYGKREYDAQIGRFFRVDPLSEKFYQLTSYQYASNDPIANIDLDGLEGTGAVSGSASKDQKQSNPPDLNKQTWGTMTIKTNVGSDGGVMDGHAWLEFKRVDGQVTTLSLWGNQGDQEFFANKEVGADAATSRTTTITNGDIDKINSFDSNPENVDWTCTNTCAGYSARLWDNVTGENLDASNWVGLTTPTNLAGSIINQNGGKNSNTPNAAQANANGSSNGDSGSSSGSGSGSSASNSSFTNSGSSRSSNSSSGSSASNSSVSQGSSGGAAKQTQQQLNVSNNGTTLRKIYNPTN